MPKKRLQATVFMAGNMLRARAWVKAAARPPQAGGKGLLPRPIN
jgi:hypothetical protein